MKDKFEDFYIGHLSEFGATAQGVGWKNKEAQWVRFKQLFKIFTDTKTFVSINDLGCGVGDFVTFLKENTIDFQYTGYDVMPEMIQKARQKFSNESRVTFHLIESAKEMSVADFTVASGIFNIRFSGTDDEWLNYILDTITVMNQKSLNGFAFNVLTKYSDKEYMKKELYYADPGYLFDFCKRNFAKNVALLHDYDQYDFTILVRKKL